MNEPFHEDGAGGADADLDEADDQPDIQDLLDLGYSQLDGFHDWLETRIGMDTRAAQQDCINAESFVDYLANHARRAAADVDEYHLRWFMFSHSIRKSLADRETQERLPDSLQRFFQYLCDRYGAELPEWINSTLDDRMFYLQRLRAMQVLATEDEAEWKSGFRLWCDELAQDLDARALWLPEDMGEGMIWGDKMGWREGALRDEANAQWQLDRAQLLADGIDAEEIRNRLHTSYLIWLDTPQDRLEGASPRDTIRGERAEQGLEREEDDGIEDEM